MASNDAPPRANASAETQISSSARAGHQAGGERGGVAEHRVRPPEARAHLAREDASLAHPDVDRERKALVDDRPHRAEHPLLVVAERLRSARDQDDSSAVAIDVALEERHAVLVRSGLDGPDEAVERVAPAASGPRSR